MATPHSSGTLANNTDDEVPTDFSFFFFFGGGGAFNEKAQFENH
jgi:hypothetical protein